MGRPHPPSPACPASYPPGGAARSAGLVRVASPRREGYFHWLRWVPMEVGARPPGGALLTEWPNLHSPGMLRPMGRCWVRPAGMLSPALTQLAGFAASSKIERPPTRLTSPPPHLRWRPTSPRQVGGGDLRRPETSTLGRYVGNVRCRGPTFPFERAFTTGWGGLAAEQLTSAGHRIGANWPSET